MEMTHYFHVVEASQKQLFDLRLGHAAYEYIEQDYVHMLEPPERFETLIEEGEYLLTREPALLIRYSSDVAFYKTTLNNTSLFLARQKDLGDDLAALIHTRYGLIQEP